MKPGVKIKTIRTRIGGTLKNLAIPPYTPNKRDNLSLA
jgi:hypothetical protein